MDFDVIRANEWFDIKTAPRDGTAVILTWMDGGAAQEIYTGMVWNRFAGNLMVQDGKGIWALHSRLTGEILMTWSEANADGAPTHWQPMPPLCRGDRGCDGGVHMRVMMW